MATASSGSSHLGMTENQKRWLVFGIALNKILVPQIRPFVEQDINTEYNNLKTSHNIHVQSTSGRLQRWPQLQVLMYENINGNDGHPKLPGRRPNYSLYDCRVTSRVDFARLYVQNHMARFTAFDDHCDASAVLTLLGRVPVFPVAVQTAADHVREERNDWGHCDFGIWDQTKFLRCFTEMEQLVRSMALPTADEGKLLGEIKDWETTGMQLCMNSPVDPALLQMVQQELKFLQDGVKNMSVEYEKVRTKVQSELQNCSIVLWKVQQRVERLEIDQQNIEWRTRRTEKRISAIEDKLSKREVASEVQLRVQICCETTPDPSSDEGASGMFEASQESQTGTEETNVLQIVPGRTQAEAAGIFGEASNGTDQGLPSTQEVLSLIALKFFQEIDQSKPEEIEGFLQYMEEERQAFILDVQSEGLIITVECGSLEILEGLWKDYITGYLNEMVQKYLVTEDILQELGLREVKLTATIVEEEYRACQERFVPSSARFRMILDCLEITAVSDPQGSPEMGGVNNGAYPTTQDVLNLAAIKYLQTIDPSRPENLNGFVNWLKEVKKVLIVGTEVGCLIITVKCRSLQILQELWDDYCSGVVTEMAQKFLVTEEVLNELNLTNAKLTTTIPRKEYKVCQEQLLRYLLYSVKNQGNELLYQFLRLGRMRKRTRTLLKDSKTQLSGVLPREEERDERGGVLQGAAREETFPERFKRYKVTVNQAIEEDREECEKLKAMISEDVLGKGVVDFARFCRKHRHSVLSSGILEGEFAFLIDIVRGTRSHGAARPRPTLLNENVNIQFERVRNDLEQLQRSETIDEASVTTQQVLDKLQECPSDDELEARFANFSETRFAEAFAS